jgi:uncharacterized membrane protein YkoI
MQQVARTSRGWRHWTGRVLPVLAVALLAIGPAHTKDKKKKKHEAEAAAQVERQEQVESKAQAERSAPVPTPGERPALLGKESKEAPAPVQNIREPARAERRVVSIDSVIEQVERRYKARVIKREPKQKGDRLIYELKLLTDDDRVKTIRIDAETGKEI